MEPTVGRIVRLFGGSYPSPEGGCAAIITHVWSGDTVNLTVFDSNGQTHSETSVQRRFYVANTVTGEQAERSGRVWDWPERV